MSTTITPTLLAVGTAVRLTDEHGSRMTGTIAGHGTIAAFGAISPSYLVELDQGFYNPEHTCFVSHLTAHPDNVMERPYCTEHSTLECPFE